MAVRTFILRMRATQGKAGLLAVVKIPDCPAIGRMAGVALLAQPTLVHILLRVTIIAFARATVESLRAMALRATDHHMQAQQREFRQVMIEADFALPMILAVATVATGAELGTVRIGGTMTGKALGTELLLRHFGRVAGMATQFRVRPRQGKFGLRGMIVVHGLPVFIAVAVIALQAQPTGM